VDQEISQACEVDPGFAHRLSKLADARNLSDLDETREEIWSLFFPEGVGIFGEWEERVESLRSSRTVRSLQLNSKSIKDPAREILFTSNVLLTLPMISEPEGTANLSDSFKQRLEEVLEEPQLYWYDHPIPVGVRPENNEVLYGLGGLRQALQFESERGNVADSEKLKCILSVSVTHSGLHEIATEYLRSVIQESRLLDDLEIFVFTEVETVRMIEEILKPAAETFLGRSEVESLFEVLGVDGEYGRHYSFLKAISAFWQVLINREIRATFKIDLDQVFPQEELVAHTGRSAFEHFTTPLWGSSGLDALGRKLDLGMIAGALVNNKDIALSVFTPDVTLPSRNLVSDEHIFFSQLPQALSTEAEMMTRYSPGSVDGVTSCLQRIHVTGGTNGILVDSLRKYRPFTPSFIERAEDQAYIMSTFGQREELLGYVHQDGLIMRHDKEIFAQDAIQLANLGKLIGDYVRILKFSAYAQVIKDGLSVVKERLDPFTGCFISRIPVTVTCLRFGLRASRMFSEGQEGTGQEFIRLGGKRLAKTMEFVGIDLKERLSRERAAWDLYYDILSSLEVALDNGQDVALQIASKARKIVDSCQLSK
jgi:hypothetical protein